MNNEPLTPRVGYEVSQPRYSVSHAMVTTAFELPGYRVKQNLGIVRGIIVRSRNVFRQHRRGLSINGRRQHHRVDAVV